VGYLIAAIPHALVLALLSAVAGLIPSLGSGLVWLPAGGFLLISGRIADGIVVLVFGCIAGVSDNVLRPLLSRFGHLRVPALLLFCAMLGGVMAFGPAGLVLGPLFIRLTMEALELWSDRHRAPLVRPGVEA
jgi:predicted PurR-regulated permease PerM